MTRALYTLRISDGLVRANDAWGKDQFGRV